MQKMVILSNGVASLENDLMTREVQVRGLERDLMVKSRILPLLKPGNWVVDGGAAIGDHTVAYLRAVGEKGRVFAFEPSPEFFKCLLHNCPKAESMQVALWDKETELFLRFASGNVGASQLKESKPEHPKSEWFGPVKAITLDSLNLERLDFIKLDLEGSECFALNGMRETLKRHRPKMVIEVNKPMLSGYGLAPCDLHRLIGELGYRQESICNKPGEDCEYCDVLCTPK